MATAATAATAAGEGWLRGPAWDSLCLGFCWVPFYLWFVLGLGLGGEPLGLPTAIDHAAALTVAVTVVLGLTWIHRHYTFVLVYGDAETFRARAREYVAAPLVMAAVVLVALAVDEPVVTTLAGAEITLFGALLVLSGAWNVWHTVQQRYGILRIYAGKSGHQGLGDRAHARRDRILLWGSVALVALLLLARRQSTFASHPNARRVAAALEPVSSSGAFTALTALSLLAMSVVAVWWLHHELRAAMPLRRRLPRWSFLASTLLLLAVFVVHGPIVGYLCFGTAHAVEYVAFVHHFGQRKFARPGARGVAAALLRRPLVLAPVLIGALGGLYLLLRGYRDSEVYLGYYVVSSLLHFLYDGWIWKVRRPEVHRPLGITAASGGPPPAAR